MEGRRDYGRTVLQGRKEGRKVEKEGRKGLKVQGRGLKAYTRTDLVSKEGRVTRDRKSVNSPQTRCSYTVSSTT